MLPESSLEEKITPLQINRLDDGADQYKDVKDPSVVRMPNGSYEMFASIGNSKEEIWKVGHFKAESLTGPWQELEPVKFYTPPELGHNLNGLNCAAPAVILETHGSKVVYKMYIQTTCFQENGVIAIATSEDGTHFTAQPETVATTSLVTGTKPLVNVYDVGISKIQDQAGERLAAVFTGCTKLGCGDLYYASRPVSGSEKDWTPGKLLLDQRDVPFHNQPHMPHFEWGLEAGQVIQLDKNLYLLAAVCFLEKDGKQFDGTRQRVFFAVSHSPDKNFVPMGVTMEPECGENGHADMIIDKDNLNLLFQKRSGQTQPWGLSLAQFNLEQLKEHACHQLAYHRARVPNDSAQGSWATRSLSDQTIGRSSEIR